MVNAKDKVGFIIIYLTSSIEKERAVATGD
jgi:hypothetical protein